MEELLKQLIQTLFEIAKTVGLRLVFSMIFLVVGAKITKFVCNRIKNGKKMSNVDKNVASFLNSLIKISINVAVVIGCLLILGVPAASFVTAIASCGLAIGLALQGSLSNFAGGLMLLIFKPIAGGELVEVGGNIGTVTEVGIFYTKIKTPDNLVVTVPNKTLVDTTIKNYSKNNTRRVDIVVGVAYDSDVELVKKTILSVIEANDKALQDPAPFVRITNMGDSSLDFTVRVWCNSSNFGLLKSDLYEEINAAFNNAGIEIPYNKLDVNIMK